MWARGPHDAPARHLGNDLRGASAEEFWRKKQAEAFQQLQKATEKGTAAMVGHRAPEVLGSGSGQAQSSSGSDWSNVDRAMQMATMNMLTANMIMTAKVFGLVLKQRKKRKRAPSSEGSTSSGTWI